MGRNRDFECPASPLDHPLAGLLSQRAGEQGLHVHPVFKQGTIDADDEVAVLESQRREEASHIGDRHLERILQPGWRARFWFENHVLLPGESDDHFSR